MRPREIQRILILTKFRFIGDTLLAIPLFRAVRARWPQAHITLLTGRAAHVLLQNNPYLDEIVEYDPYQRDKGLGVYLRLLRRLRRGRFDLSLTLNRSFHSALTPWLAGVRIRAGSRAEGRSFLFTHRLSYDTNRSEIACYFDVLHAVAPDAETDPGLELWLRDEERREAARRLGVAFGADLAPEQVVGFQPGASNPLKTWDAGRFAEVAEALASDPTLHFVLFGGQDERPSAEAMLAQLSPETRARTADFVGRLDLRGSLAMVSRLGLFVGNDTAIRHAAVALNVPSVAVFGPTNPRKWGDYGGPHREVESKDGTMAGIAAADVIEAARELMSSPPARQEPSPPAPLPQAGEGSVVTETTASSSDFPGHRKRGTGAGGVRAADEGVRA